MLLLKISIVHIYLTCSFLNLHFHPFFAFSFSLCLLQKTYLGIFKEKIMILCLLIDDHKPFTLNNLKTSFCNFVPIFYFCTFFLFLAFYCQSNFQFKSYTFNFVFIAIVLNLSSTFMFIHTAILYKLMNAFISFSLKHIFQHILLFTQFLSTDGIFQNIDSECFRIYITFTFFFLNLSFL